MFILETVSCMNGKLVMDRMIPELTSTLMTLIKIGVPFILIVYGMMDLGKAVMAQKEDEIKKGQQTFFKRLIAAVVVFLVFYIVQIAINLVAGDDKDTVMNCVNCFVNPDTCDGAQ